MRTLGLITFLIGTVAVIATPATARRRSNELRIGVVSDGPMKPEIRQLIARIGKETQALVASSKRSIRLAPQAEWAMHTSTATSSIAWSTRCLETRP